MRTDGQRTPVLYISMGTMLSERVRRRERERQGQIDIVLASHTRDWWMWAGWSRGTKWKGKPSRRGRSRQGKQYKEAR